MTPKEKEEYKNKILTEFDVNIDELYYIDSRPLKHQVINILKSVLNRL